MKHLFSIFIVTSVFFISCNDNFLQVNPSTKLADTEEFWNNEGSLETFSNSFYSYIDRGEITTDFSSDIAEHKTSPPSIRRQDYVVPTSLGSGGWNWSQLRKLNYFIERTTNSNVEESVKNRYIALAKFFRAWFYFKKVKQFGDVPLYTKALDTDDEEELYKPRDSRVDVVALILDDINFAIENLPDEQAKNRITKSTALALKSRIFLYEGTWRKYHTEASLPDAENLLRESVEASRELMESGRYSLYSTSNNEEDYFNLFQSGEALTEEVILARSSDTQTFYYTPLFTSTSNGNYGATRSLVSSYLMSDGSTFQEQYPDPQQRDTMSYYSEFQNRDPRLLQTLVYPGYVRVGTTEKTVTDFNQNATGYMIHKRVGPPIEDQGGGYRDVIIIRYAEVLLNFAEAKAELGEITQDDIDASINLVRDRAGIPPLSIPVSLDEYQNSLYKNTSDPLILEIRRERKIELAYEGFRTDDLKRWEEGHRFREKYEGIYISGLNEYIDLDQDGTPDLYMYSNEQSAPEDRISSVQYVKMADVYGLSEGEEGRIIPFDRELPEFENWEYLNPIPTEELTLNPQLDQNPGWNDL